MAMSVNTPIAKRIRALRERLAESQEVFGERFGVQQATVARWENGAVPRRTLWDAIAAVAGVPAAQFFLDEPISEGIRPGPLREVLIQAFQLQGADLTRAKLLAELAIEAASTRQAAEADKAEAERPPSARTQVLRGGGKLPS